MTGVVQRKTWIFLTTQRGNLPMADGAEAEMKVISSYRTSQDIHGGAGSKLFVILKKAVADSVRTPTNAGVGVGMKSHLMDKMVARELRDFNATHAICLDAKKAASVGLGHREQKIHEVLDPLCRFHWQDVLDASAEDYWEGGECFIEVAFGDEDPRKVTFLGHLDASQVHVEIENEDDSELYHYIVDGEGGESQTRVMAKWGDLAALKARFGIGVQPQPDGSAEGADPVPLVALRNANEVVRTGTTALAGEIVDSEVIHIRQSTNRSRYYGYPDYMSAVPSIELVQVMTQFEFDFFFNRGVPEFMLFLLGKNIGQCWDKIEAMIKAGHGPGNSHKTAALHIPGSPEETKVQIERLGIDGSADNGFAEKSALLDMRIATAHGMPPQLANIALPGKIGAANEGPNAMLTFQQRKLGQCQKNFSRMLAVTLGAQGVSFAQPEGAAATLSADMFLGKGAKPMTDDGVPQFVQPGNGFNTILDGMTLGAANTLASMKEPLAGSGRNPEDGLLGGARDRKAGDPRSTRKPAAAS